MEARRNDRVSDQKQQQGEGEGTERNVGVESSGRAQRPWLSSQAQPRGPGFELTNRTRAWPSEWGAIQEVWP